MRLRVEFKVPLGGFRGSFLSDMESSYKKSGGGSQIRIS
jgi:hypothetical protein